MKLEILKGSTGVSVYVFISDTSSSTGAGKTGLVYNTANIKAYYVRPLAAAVAITLATQTVTGAFSSGGFVEVDATNMPGVYRLDVPNAALASGVNSVVIMLSGATNMAAVPLEIQLNAVDPQDATVVLTQVNSALDAAGSELSSVPSVTGTLRQKINFIFQYFKLKKTVTSSVETMLKNDNSTSLGTATVADDGTTFTRGNLS